MEIQLRCNNLQCRQGLQSEGKACVTTCSHIFCLTCANECFRRSLTCPACENPLSETEDIFCVDLNPGEDFKSSVLAGLRPETILEICSRALSFWTYQVTQEHTYQELTCKNLEDERTQLNAQLQSMIHQANAEIQLLQEKFTGLQKEHETEKRRNQELADQYADKGRQLQKLQLLYDKLKRKTIANGTAVPSAPAANVNNGAFLHHSATLLKSAPAPSQSLPQSFRRMVSTSSNNTPFHSGRSATSSSLSQPTLNHHQQQQQHQHQQQHHLFQPAPSSRSVQPRSFSGTYRSARSSGATPPLPPPPYLAHQPSR